MRVNTTGPGTSRYLRAKPTDAGCSQLPVLYPPILQKNLVSFMLVRCQDQKNTVDYFISSGI